MDSAIEAMKAEEEKKSKAGFTENMTIEIDPDSNVSPEEQVRLITEQKRAEAQARQDEYTASLQEPEEESFSLMPTEFRYLPPGHPMASPAKARGRHSSQALYKSRSPPPISPPQPRIAITYQSPQTKRSPYNPASGKVCISDIMAADALRKSVSPQGALRLGKSTQRRQLKNRTMYGNRGLQDAFNERSKEYEDAEAEVGPVNEDEPEYEGAAEWNQRSFTQKIKEENQLHSEGGM